MAGFWKTMAGAFVQVEDDGDGEAAVPADADISAEMADTDALIASIEAETAQAPPPPAIDPGPVDEGLSLEDIYSKAGVPPSPFPAEKLLKVLDGLAAMPPETRRAAIAAMDGADDSWTVDDAVLDAQRKNDILQQARQGLVLQLQAAEADADAKVNEANTYLEEASKTIHEQIRELEELLGSERQSVAQRKIEIQAHVDSIRTSVRREDARLETEIRRLYIVTQTFGVSPPPLPPAAQE
jgi:hypothetical protein